MKCIDVGEVTSLPRECCAGRRINLGPFYYCVTKIHPKHYPYEEITYLLMGIVIYLWIYHLPTLRRLYPDSISAFYIGFIMVLTINLVHLLSIIIRTMLSTFEI